MRGFALSDSLMALAIVSLLLVVMLSRGPDLEAREAERWLEAYGQCGVGVKSDSGSDGVLGAFRSRPSGCCAE